MLWKIIGEDQGLLEELRGLWQQRAIADQLGFSRARATANVCSLSCLWAQHPWPIWAGVGMDVQDTGRF